MSYIVRASWWKKPGQLPLRPPVICDTEDEAVSSMIHEVAIGKTFGQTGTVTITKDGETIREYKVGEKE